MPEEKYLTISFATLLSAKVGYCKFVSMVVYRGIVSCKPSGLDLVKVTLFHVSIEFPRNCCFNIPFVVLIIN